jgi:hypothetical protein
MNLKKQNLIALAVAAVAFSGAAHAQYYVQPAPLYPYVVQQQPYVYPQPQYAQPYPYVRTPQVRSVRRDNYAPRASEPPRKVSRTDPVLVEELRKSRHKKKNVVVVEKKDKDVEIDTKRVVREKPVVRKHVRVVDDPPIVVQREISEEGQVLSEQRVPTAQAQAPISGGRVIHAEAEVTILGPDRMNIRLYRKNDRSDAQAKALPAKRKKPIKSEQSQPET